MTEREQHSNKYVLETESGHMGFVSTSVISTRAGMQELVTRLVNALAAKEADLRDPLESPDQPLTLFREFATIARGQRSRVYLNFQIAQDLSVYHTTNSQRPAWLLLLACLVLGCALVYFAILGVRTSLGG